VFRLAQHRVVVRVALTPGLSHRAHNGMAAARVLAAHRIPAVQPLSDIPNPVNVQGYAVTFWEEITGAGTAPTAHQLAGLLTRLHQLPTADIRLPVWNPVADLRSRISAMHGWERGDLDFLAGRCDAVDAALTTLDYPLPTCVIHGDAHLGNLIPTPTGPVLCDLDTLCIGPREWDLVPLAVSQLRFGSTVNIHRQLVDAYGVDVTEWDGFPVLREIRELKLAVVGIPMSLVHPATGFELRLRLRSLRTGQASTRWTPYR